MGVHVAQRIKCGCIEDANGIAAWISRNLAEGESEAVPEEPR